MQNPVCTSLCIPFCSTSQPWPFIWLCRPHHPTHLTCPTTLYYHPLCMPLLLLLLHLPCFLPLSSSLSPPSNNQPWQLLCCNPPFSLVSSLYLICHYTPTPMLLLQYSTLNKQPHKFCYSLSTLNQWLLLLYFPCINHIIPHIPATTSICLHPPLSLSQMHLSCTCTPHPISNSSHPAISSIPWQSTNFILPLTNSTICWYQNSSNFWKLSFRPLSKPS